MAKGAGIKPKREAASRFSKSEIKQMEKLLEEGKCDVLDESFHQKLTEEFNCVRSRAGNKSIQMKQVQSWYRKRKKPSTEADDSLPSAEESSQATDSSNSNSASRENSSDMPQEKEPKQDEPEFEARSSRDNAWYDVDTFLAYRFLPGDEVEVRVRYNGFGADEDEWVKIKKSIRERSIPLESTECRLVEVGDLVLCFQEKSDEAMYFDAHVLEIERKDHDMRGCRCRFLIRYDHDRTEEKVGLHRLCRRPKY